MAATGLAGAFLAARPEAERAAFAAPALESALDAFVARARATRSALPIDATALCAFVGARLAAGAGSDALAELFAGDLALADGCVRGDPAALRIFESEHMSAIDGVLARPAPRRRRAGRGQAAGARQAAHRHAAQDVRVLRPRRAALLASRDGDAHRAQPAALAPPRAARRRRAAFGAAGGAATIPRRSLLRERIRRRVQARLSRGAGVVDGAAARAHQAPLRRRADDRSAWARSIAFIG